MRVDSSRPHGTEAGPGGQHGHPGQRGQRGLSKEDGQRGHHGLSEEDGQRGLAARIARSAAATGPATGARTTTGEIVAWLAERRRAHGTRIRRIPFAELDGWSFQADTGNLVHRSGRFFTVEGMRVHDAGRPGPPWEQPVMRQPEVGVLGLLAKEFDGVLHFLAQAKMEPGNRGMLQLSPTVQATRSNYQRVHGGSGVRFLQFFTEPGRARPLTDTLQSEHGEWFLHKSNRNVVVETADEVAEDPAAEPDFRWLTLGQIGELLRLDNVVNMDTRTVLACLPTPGGQGPSQHTDAEVSSWLGAARSRSRLTAEPVRLARVRGWLRDEQAVRSTDDRHFRVVAVAVEADGREVGSWTQPLFEPCGPGVSAFLFRHFDGVPHLLAHARAEAGLPQTVEVGPTVCRTPDGHGHGHHPAYADVVRAADDARVRYAAVHSEEGGRFLYAESRCLFVSVDGVDDSDLLTPPPDHLWITPGQLGALTGRGHQVTVQARTLLAVLNSGAARLS
ncbi:NDP-hexose 2,3-dehydratase family protein [Streptomyces sp. DH18]|uniref:NDP-hexose 2,3-dehydratase family protein n=1 Tax=Streptomyces sp. DH18 TaxID=3040126 RepID=UPI0024418FE4|nr:NDP-hexose 2,3-dehydratase family protein [Streptomyces sp. DH18]MDG9688223.1 NDP-hexose 2,3-dehydratase family protein [Streptomyces sp. DH18]